MALKEMLFWFFITVFGTGTFVIFEQHVFWGTAMILIGMAGMVGCAWPYLNEWASGNVQLTWERLLRIRNLRIIVLVVVIAILASIGITAYRHYHPNVSTSGSARAVSSAGSPDDSQYQLFNLSPEQKAEMDKLKARLYQYKAEMLDAPEYYKAKVAKEEFRNLVEDTESQYGCLIDLAKFKCLLKPPATIAENRVDINISTKMVADELSKSFFWVIHNNVSKLRVPIVLFVSFTNRQSIPLRIGLLYVDAKSVDGWVGIRMADSWTGNVQPMSARPLILQAKNASVSMKGEYLLPSLYDRIIQPGDKVEGWIIAEYPKGFKYGSSIGDMRISLLANGHWIASKTFPANPRVYKDDRSSEWYFAPLNTLVTEDW